MGALPWPLTDDSTVCHLVLSEYPLLHYSDFPCVFLAAIVTLILSPDKNMRPKLPPSNLVSGHLINLIRLSWDRVPSKRPSFEKMARELKKQRAGGATSASTSSRTTANVMFHPSCCCNEPVVYL
jgi:hypothetical protein